MADGALANIEGLMKIIADGLMIAGLAIGGPILLWGLIQLGIGAPEGVLKVILGLGGVFGGLITPWLVSALLAYVRNSHFFG